MKMNQEINEELIKYKLPKKTTSLLLDLMSVDNYELHTNAKKELIGKGTKILPALHKLTNSEIKVIRKEAMKIVEQISHKSSISVAIRLLRDSESDIRWSAAETLIHIGRDSIKPLLEELTNHGMSYYLRQGAHHVLSALILQKDSRELHQLVHVLKTEADIPERIHVDAANALRTV